MAIANIHEAKSQLSKLVDQAMNGEAVTIAKAGRPKVRLAPIHTNSSPRHEGQWKGRVRIADDFDTLPDDIATAFGIDCLCVPTCLGGRCSHRRLFTATLSTGS
jgi:prevent-host-death family protein